MMCQCVSSRLAAPVSIYRSWLVFCMAMCCDMRGPCCPCSCLSSSLFRIAYSHAPFRSLAYATSTGPLAANKINSNAVQDSLGGNSKTVMIANISPSTLNITETQSTLRFAQRAKRMGNKAMVNEDTTGDAEQLRRELARVKRQIANCSCGASRTSGGACPPTPALLLEPQNKVRNHINHKVH